MKSTFLRMALGGLALLGLASAAAVPAAAQAPASDPNYAAIDSYVSNSLAGTPGFALSIVHGDQVVHVMGFGTASSGSPVTGDTPFVLGSEAKSFTALGIMQLKERGSLDLDAPVQHYLPWFRVADPTYSRQITIRQLLNQTSGLPPSFPLETPVTSVASRVHDLATVNLPYPPGRLFQYSNSNYDTLGLVVEAISGQSYGDYIQQHVFAPLGMTHTYASESAAKAGGLAPGHEWFLGLPVAFDNYRSDFIPAGFVVSSASDMGRYLVAQLSGGNYAGRQVLSPQGIAEMHRGVAKDGDLTYGMGWADGSVNGIPVVEHDGDAVTFHTDMILVPGTGWGVEVIANASSMPVNLSNSIDATAKGVISTLAGQPAPFTPSPLTTYIVFDLLVGGLVGFQVWSLVRVLRHPVLAPVGRVRTLIHLVMPLAWRLPVAAVVFGVIFVELGGLLGVSPLLMAETDLGAPVIAISGLLLINGALRTVRAYRSMHSRHAVPATAASLRVQEVAS